MGGKFNNNKKLNKAEEVRQQDLRKANIMVFVNRKKKKNKINKIEIIVIRCS